MTSSKMQKGKKMVARWSHQHPAALMYIGAVVTLSLILQIVWR